MKVKQLKSAIMDFYVAETLSAAQVCLLRDNEALNTSVGFPRVPQRRDGDNRLAREAEDIITLFTRLDKSKLLDSLPTYVLAS